MANQLVTFRDFMNTMFTTHELVWVGKGTKETGCVVRPGSIVPAGTIQEGNNFFTPNSLRTPDERKDENANFHTLFCECDDDDQEVQLALAKEHRKILTAVVDSGNRSLHMFSRLDSGFTSKEEWLRYQIKFYFLFKGDPSKTGASGAMRLPFGIRQDEEGIGNKQRLVFPVKTAPVRHSKEKVCAYLDAQVADEKIQSIYDKKTGKKVKAPFHARLPSGREQEIAEALKEDGKLKRLIEKLNGEKGKGDEIGKAICYHVHDKYGWSTSEMASILEGTRKGKDYHGEWPMNTAVHVLEEIAQKQRDANAEPEVSIPEVIKRYIQKRGDSTKNEVATALQKQNGISKKSTYNAIGQLLKRKELFTRDFADVQLLSLRAPALYDDDDFRATLHREWEEKHSRIPAYPHPHWNDLSGGGLIRGVLTGLVSPTSTGKTHCTTPR